MTTPVHTVSTTGAVKVVGVQMDLFALQMIRQRRTTWVRATLFLLNPCWRLFGVWCLVIRVHGNRFAVATDAIDEQLELIRVEFLTLAAVGLAQQGIQALGQKFVLTPEFFVLFEQEKVDRFLLGQLFPQLLYNITLCAVVGHVVILL